MCHVSNWPGWRTDRTIVVIESDDWGSIRMPSRETLNELILKGYPLEKCTYSSNDALETNKDLEYLLDILNSVRDAKGHPAIFTVNNIVANPDFKKIKEANFRKYFYEPFVASLERFPNRDKVMSLYRKGIDEKLLKPQFHGREHVHADHWINTLRNGSQKLLEIFDHDMFTYYKGENSSCKSEFLDALAAYDENQLTSLETKIKEGLDLFEEIWGYRSKTIIAPCYIWNRKTEEFFHRYGINLIQSGRVQKEPTGNEEKYNLIRRYTGQKNKYGQVYTIRNVIFEPTSDPSIDWVDKALHEISTAFLWKKPAIISAHRVNFSGSINPNNREKSLDCLYELLNKILKKWPEVEFMSSDQLAKLIMDN